MRFCFVFKYLGSGERKWRQRRKSFKRSERRPKGRPGEVKSTQHMNLHFRYSFQFIVSYARRKATKHWIIDGHHLTFFVWYRLLPSSVDCFAMRLWTSCFPIQPCWTIWTFCTNQIQPENWCFIIKMINLR